LKTAERSNETPDLYRNDDSKFFGGAALGNSWRRRMIAALNLSLNSLKVSGDLKFPSGGRIKQSNGSKFQPKSSKEGENDNKIRKTKSRIVRLCPKRRP